MYLQAKIVFLITETKRKESEMIKINFTQKYRVDIFQKFTFNDDVS